MSQSRPARGAALDAEKRRRVVEYLLEHASESDHAVARACEVSQPFTSKIRRKMGEAGRNPLSRNPTQNPPDVLESGNANRTAPVEELKEIEAKEGPPTAREPGHFRSPDVGFHGNPLASPENPRQAPVRPGFVDLEATVALAGGTGDVDVLGANPDAPAVQQGDSRRTVAAVVAGMLDPANAAPGRVWTWPGYQRSSGSERFESGSALTDFDPFQ